jgi:benzoyl-CoA reductase/2-hydroxyglutaryl-CoA dehydratase subunit BcrC/BadD/HgdB
MQQKILNNLPPEIKNTVLQLHDTILKRSLMQAYKNLDNDKKAMMAEIFNSNDDEQKSDFLHNYLGDLQDIITKETKKITEEIKKEPIS